MKLVLIHFDGDDGDVLLKMGSEFPPIEVTKWLHSVGGAVRIRYGRARLRNGFAYFYAPREELLAHRVAAAEPLVRSLNAPAILYPRSLGSENAERLLDVGRSTGSALVEISGDDRRKHDLVRVSRAQGREYDEVTRLELAVQLHQRTAVIAGLWELHQELSP